MRLGLIIAWPMICAVIAIVGIDTINQSPTLNIKPGEIMTMNEEDSFKLNQKVLARASSPNLFILANEKGETYIGYKSKKPFDYPHKEYWTKYTYMPPGNWTVVEGENITIVFTDLNSEQKGGIYLSVAIVWVIGLVVVFTFTSPKKT